MGDIADMMLDGTLCAGCGVFLNSESPGFSCYCKGCRKDRKEEKTATYQQPKPKVKCSICGRKVKPTGLADHMRDAHPSAQGEK